MQATCKLCDTPVSVTTAIHRGLCRAHSQLERSARLARIEAGKPTSEDLLITRMNEVRKTYVKKRPCATCGTLVRTNRLSVARCKPCFLQERYGTKEKRTLIPLSMRLPAAIVIALREEAGREGRSITAMVEKTLAHLVGQTTR